ncbi:MAG: protein kinase [Kofleriaceae bacterium]|nr:protein kinase [Kofleriaceae bacterium]
MFCPVCRADYPSDWKRCPKDEAVLLRSQTIGKYRVEGLLGVGGMGAVYRAINPDTKANVAIKVMNAALENSDAARARFVREAAAVGALRTAHVASIYDFGSEADGAMYLVMEFLQGHGLRSEIASGEHTIPLPRFAMILDGALRGLSAAHRAGIVHRDLKPENIFIATNDDGEIPKLLDFGIARVKSRDSDLTHSGAIMGTPGYMAPEQVGGARGSIGPWTDIYAMGVIGYEMLTGISPFAGDTMNEVLMKIIDRRFTPLPEARPGLPAALYALIDQCLLSDPSQRPADADAMRERLREIGLLTTSSMQVPAFVPKRNLAMGNSATVDADAAGTAPTVTPHIPTPHTVAPRAVPAPVEPTIAVHQRPAALVSGAQAAASAGAPAALGKLTPALAKRRMPLVLGASVVAVAAVAGFVWWPRQPATAVIAAPTTDRVVVDAPAPVPTPDAPTIIDAAVTKTLPAELAALPADDTRRNWLVFMPGEYQVGQSSHPSNKAVPYLPSATVVVQGFAMMPTEMSRQMMRDAKIVDDPGFAALPFASDAADAPMRGLTANQAQAACTSLNGRLPTEIEWDIAARTTPNDPARAILLNQPAAAAKDCSAQGLCNMLGSLSEWTSTAWPGAAQARVVRGASFAVGPKAGWHASIHARVKVMANASDPEVGFRCVIPLSGGRT